MPEVSPLIRLFISSTFADFAFEREVLQRTIFPRLRTLCAAQGCRFQPIDLRWGVNEEAGNNKQTLAICLEEIARCQRLSPDLNLLILLGDRYGSCFLPESISSDQVARLLPHLAPIQQTAFTQAYREDLNALRPEFVLLSSDGSAATKQREESLRQALAQAAQMAGFSEAERLPFVASATHLEIEHGLLNADCDPAAVICTHRSFASMPDASRLAQYVEQDPRRRAQLAELKTTVEQRLSGRVWHYTVPGQISGLRIGQAARALYRSVAEGYYALLEPRIQQALALRTSSIQMRDPSVEVNRQFAASRASVVVGRDDALGTISAYLARQTPQPLVVTGDSGVGKSTVLARAAENAALTHPNAVILTRYIGVTPGTSDLPDLLSNLRREIAVRYGLPTPSPIGKASDLTDAFTTLLQSLEVPAARPLLLFVDALDQLSAQPQPIGWLPRTLAPHVRIVLSVSSDREELAALPFWLPATQVLQLAPLTRTQNAEVIRAWLTAEGRRLTSVQEDAVLGGGTGEQDDRGVPLYLRLAFEQTRTWHSFEPEHPHPLPPTATALIQSYLSKLEDPSRHGRELVAYALGDLAAAKHGLAEDELLDVLSRSAEVRQALGQLNPGAPPIKAQRPLPVALWARLVADLDRYLTEREADGARLVTFYHRQIREEAKRRYLDGTEQAARHTDLATYFNNRQRYLLGDASATRWNRRKLAELAYQQAGAGQEAREALVATLTDGRFLEGKLAVEGVAATLTDLEFSADEGDVAKIASVVRAGAVVLAVEPTELLNQIVGRAGSVARLHDLPARHSPTLRLRTQSLQPLDSSLAHILQGHTDIVHDCALSANGQVALSASADKTLRLWDTTTSECVRIFTGHEDAVIHCALSGDGRRALSVEGSIAGRTPHDTKVRVWDTTSGQCLHILEGHSDKVTECALSLDGRLALSASADKTLRVWDVTTGRCIHVLQGHAGSVYGCALSADGHVALSSGADSMRMWDTQTGQSTHAWSPKTTLYSGHSCDLSADGQTALSIWRHDLPLSSDQESTIYHWNILSSQPPRLLWSDAKRIWGCALSADGRLALLSSDDQALRLLDTATGQSLSVFEGHTGWVHQCALSADGRLALSASSDHTLRIWDVPLSTARFDQTTGMRKPRAKRVQHCALSADGRVAVSVSTDASKHNEDALRVWNPAKGDLLYTLQGEFANSAHCALSADGRLIFSDSVRYLNTAPVRTWDTTSGRALRVFKHYTGEVGGCALSADGRLALFAAEQNPWGGMFHLLVSPTSSPSERRYLYLWDTITGRTVRRIKVPGSQVHDCALSADGSLALTAHPSEWKVLVWDLARGRVLQELKGHRNRVFRCALSANGALALSASWDSTARLWNTATGECLHELKGHTHWVSDCALSADGRLAASVCAEDRTLRIWDTTRGREICRFTHDSELRSCSLNTNGSMVMVGDGSNSVHFLDLQGFECVPPVPPITSWLTEREHHSAGAGPQQWKRGY